MNKVKSIIKRIAQYVLMILCIPAVLIIRLISPWKHVYLGYFDVRRIGHVTVDAMIELGRRQEEKKSNVYWYYALGKTCNEAWLNIMHRHFYIRPWVKWMDMCNRKIPGGESHYRPPGRTTGSRDLTGVVERTGVTMPFTKEETNKAKSWLKSKGWKEGEKFVALMVRDSGYLSAKTQSNNQSQIQKHHEYRNSDIASYVKAAEWLADRDVWVLRMGQKMLNRIPSDHPKIIDYAFETGASPLLDVWIIANCHFGIATLTGMDSIAVAYRRPIVFVNAMPIAHLISWHNIIHVPKNMVYKSSGHPVPLKEHVAHYYFSTVDYESNDIELVDLTEDEILSAVQERYNSLLEDVESSVVDTQERFWNALKQVKRDSANRGCIVYDDLHGWIHPSARVGQDWYDKSLMN